MAYKLKVKDKIYDLKDGFTIKEELNETLDSATGIEFETFHEEFNGVPFDHAVIFDDGNKITEKHFLIDTYDDEVYSFETNMEDNNHHYVVKLFSETKGLERITMPCLSITQSLTEARKTVKYFLQVYDTLYIPKYKRYTPYDSRPNHYFYEHKYEFTAESLSKFANIECPEFQWNYPTFREVLTDLFSVEDCIPVVRKGKISYYSLREKGNPIDTSKLSYSKRTMSSGDFVGELTLNMKNAIGKSTVTCCEYLTLQAPEGVGTLTTENGVIKTLNPIYNIKKLIIYGFVDDSVNDRCRIFKADFASRIKEYEDWNTLSNVKVGGTKYNSLPDKTDNNWYTTKEHKVNYLYYERGKTEIHNLANAYSAVGIYAASFVGSVVFHTFEGYGMPSGLFPYKDSRTLLFYVEYETILDNPINIGKYLPSPHPENRVFDAQKDSYVDVQHQTIFEYAKVERLGNKIREIYGEYFNESDIPQLGDYIGDEILFSKEVTYFDNILLFKGYLTPHYVLKDYYTGVMAKKRSWEIAKGSEALTRHDIYKLYIESTFAGEKKDDFNDLSLDPYRIFRRLDTNESALNLFLSALSDYSANKNICHAFVRTRIVGEDYPVNGTNDGIICDLSTEVQGNSICFNFGFNDNFKSAEYIENEDGEYKQSFYKYCSNTGYMQTAKIYLLGKNYRTGYPLPRIYDWYTYEETDSVINNNYKSPRFTESAAKHDNDGFEILTYVVKDNREIIKWNIQFEYCSDTADIIIGRKLIEKSSIINPNANEIISNLKLSFSGTKYRIGETKIHSDSTSYSFDNFLRLVITKISNYCSKVEWTTSGEAVDVVEEMWENKPYWAICDNDGNILIAVNSASSKAIYFNVLRSRDTKVYMNSWSQEVAGDISDIEHIEPVE